METSLEYTQLFHEIEFDRDKLKAKLLPSIFEDFYHEIQQIKAALRLACDVKDLHPKVAERRKSLLSLDMESIIGEMLYVIILKQCTSVQDIVSTLLPKLPKENSMYHNMHCAADIIAMSAHADIFDTVLPDNKEIESVLIQSNYAFDDELQEFIDNTMYLPPMVCKPRKLTSNTSSALLTKKHDSVILKVTHNEPVNLEVLNILNSFELSLDTEMLEHEEVPNKPKKAKSRESKLLAKQAFSKLKVDSKYVTNLIIELGNVFYLTWKYDKRGRIYSQGYHINLQSTDYKKSVLSLAEKVIIPFEE